jgi:hypothetical protein
MCAIFGSMYLCKIVSMQKNKTRMPYYYQIRDTHMINNENGTNTHEPVIIKLSINKRRQVSGQSCNQRGNIRIVPYWII